MNKTNLFFHQDVPDRQTNRNIIKKTIFFLSYKRLVLSLFRRNFAINNELKRECISSFVITFGRSEKRVDV